MNIAIIGSGISGLTAAHLLGRNHTVSVFEADDRIGGHAHTVDVEVDGTEFSVDTGFIVYNERTYPNFCRLLEALGVKTQPSDMSFSTTAPHDGVEYATHSINALFARRQSLVDAGFYRMIQDILRFNRDSRRLLRIDSESPLDLTLGKYLASQSFSRRFIEHYILPMGAAIWSAAPDRFLDIPASTFVRFFDNHGLLNHRGHFPWRTITNGSRSYVSALVNATKATFHTSSPVLGVRRSDQRIDVTLRKQGTRSFDHVVFACHSDTALSLLDDASEQEEQILGAIGYQTNEVLLHTDTAAMPQRPRAWASWNYRVSPPKKDEASTPAMLTYWMNRLQSIDSPRPLLVSLNSGGLVDERQVLRSFTYHHPIYDQRALDAQSNRRRIDGIDRTHFCGAYWGHGFHEDGVASALKVCGRFGEHL